MGLVEAVELLPVALEDHAALHLERRRQHAIFGGEVLEDEHEVLHGLLALDVLAEGVDLAADEVVDPFARAHFLAQRNALPLRPGAHGIGIRNDESNVVQRAP